MSHQKYRQNTLLVTAFLGTFAGSIFWTGFPIALAKMFGSELSLSVIYLVCISGSLVFDVVGGFFSDFGSVKYTAVTSLVISSSLLVVLSFLFENKSAVLALLPIIYFNFSIGNLAESAWLLKLAPDVREGFLNRRAITIVAKIFGFSVGPVIFSFYPSKATLLCAGLFVVSALIQMIAIPAVRVNTTFCFRTSLESVKLLSQKPTLIAGLFLTGFLTVPMSPLIVSRLLSANKLESVSLFWLFAGIAGFIAVLAIRYRDFLKSIFAISVLTLLAVACFAGAFFSVSVLPIIAAGSIYVFASVAMSVSIQSRAVSNVVSDRIGMNLGLIDAVVDFGIFMGLLFSSVSEGHTNTIAYVLIVLIGLRGITQARLVAPAADVLRATRSVSGLNGT